MGVQILHDREQGRACMFDSVTETAFGPVICDELGHFAEAYVDYVRAETGVDPRDVPRNKLAKLYEAWRDRLTEQIAEAA